MTLMVVWIVILLILYGLLLIILIFNIVQYLIRQGRFKTFHIAFFYATSFCIVIIRILYFSYVLAYLFEWQNDKSLCPWLQLNIIDNFGVYCELILGVQQVSMMVDLNLMIRFSSLDPN